MANTTQKAPSERRVIRMYDGSRPSVEEDVQRMIVDADRLHAAGRHEEGWDLEDEAEALACTENLPSRW